MELTPVSSSCLGSFEFSKSSFPALCVSAEHDGVQRHATLEEKTILRIAHGAQSTKTKNSFQLRNTFEHGGFLGDGGSLCLWKVSKKVQRIRVCVNLIDVVVGAEGNQRVCFLLAPNRLVGPGV